MSVTTIIIGYGNELRSDDAIGQKVANIINSWHLSDVESLAVHQLTPELAANLANVNLAIFVDAMMSSESENVEVESILPTESNMMLGHIGDPRSLLSLTKYLYGYCPTAWLVTVPGVNFELGDCLSPIAEIGINIALNKIINIIGRG
ncbi:MULTISPECIES: hydrogenase maturation protease [Nostocales]|uniref:Hydrogenase maturation protease n=1 Tax=Dolichospermum planctonicum TaxID=136072 RepID=A0A480ABL4_9CYAN|nr:MULTISPECIES: hydrogenase maturation protease [Nostocales]MBD2269445.1 hydrogenase maturation protease [Anabaena sp. FACHB-1391]GCL41133.1 hydrogenase maturation protease [Dolichospermum planctonicum]